MTETYVLYRRPGCRRHNCIDEEWSFFRNDFNPLWNSEVVQPFLLFSCCPQLWHWLSASQGAHLYMSTEIIGRKSITGTKQSWVHTYYLHVHWIMEIPLMDSVADKSSELSLDTHWPENDLLWYFHNRWCRLFGHEKNRQSADYHSGSC